MNDYLPGFSFDLGSDHGESDVSTKYFDILSNEYVITFTTPVGYTVETPELINDNKKVTYKITCNETVYGIEDDIKDIQDQKDELTQLFNQKYRRFIQEGTWNSTDYIDSELYYLDALQVSNTSAQPIVSYTINVVEISQLEGYEWYIFDAGDKSWVEDTEFFGWSEIDGNLTPAREEVIVSQVEWHLDEPDQNTITVQNYKTRFEDLFQRISATVQTVQYNEATYAKISSLLDADGTINQNVLLESLNNISGKNYNLTSDGSVLIDGDQILVRNLTNPANLVKINSEGIRISSDGGSNWATAIDGRGINIGTVYTGMLSTDKVIIGSTSNPSFRWDKSGISAYSTNGTTTDEEGHEIECYDLQTYVRYDQYGLYGIKNGEQFKATNIEEVKNKAHFAVTWDGFFIKNSYEGGGRVEITSDNDFRVLNTINQQENEKIKIGALEWHDANGDVTTDPVQGVGAPILYGIRIKNDSGQEVMKTDDQGNITITGTINANAGNIGGMSVNNNWMRMKYIVFEPEVGIYSTYPNIKGQTPIDSTVTIHPFSISDTDGSATFNNVTVRGAIKTSVFEYEEIQAVGGAFLFRPSSTIKDVVISNTTDLTFTVDNIGLFKGPTNSQGQPQEPSWLKISNYNSSGIQEVTPDVLNGFGLTYIYPVGAITGRQVTLTGAAAMLIELNLTLEDLKGGSLIDMGTHKTKVVTIDEQSTTVDIPGDYNYGIGINSSDGFINLPPRAISLFETVIHPNQDPKVSYRFRGILGTLPELPPTSVNTLIYNNMIGTQGIYTDNMYLGDLQQYVAFYTDGNGNKQLAIKAKQIMFEVADNPGHYHDVAQIEAEGIPGPAGEDAIYVVIDSTGGNFFNRGQLNTYLIAHVYKGSEEITNQFNTFNWYRRLPNGNIDPTWRTDETSNLLQLTTADVDERAVFVCEVTIA